MPQIGEWSISRLMSTAARMFENNWNRQLQSLGLTHAGVMALDVISREGGLTQAQVAQTVGVQAQTMGKTLARLEAYGHIARERSAVDRRSYVLVATDSGRDRLQQALRIEQDLAGTGVLDHEALRKALEQVILDLSAPRGGSGEDVQEAMEQLPEESRVVARDLAASLDPAQG